MDMRFHHWGFGELVALFNHMDAKQGAEIGVYNGEKSILLDRYLNLDKLYLIDPYIVYKDVSINDSQKVHDTRYNMICFMFENNSNIEIIRKKSRDAINDIPDNSLDFVYIDADHSYEEIKWDIENWIKKVRKGGIISGHDYHGSLPEVQHAVVDYCIKHNISIIHILEQDHIWSFKKETD